MRDIVNRELGRRNRRLSRNPGQIYRVSSNAIAAYQQELADFRRFLGDVAVESLTADPVRNYVACVLNRSIGKRGLMHQAIAGGQDFWRKVYVAHRQPATLGSDGDDLDPRRIWGFFDHYSPLPIATNPLRGTKYW